MPSGHGSVTKPLPQLLTRQGTAHNNGCSLVGFSGTGRAEKRASRAYMKGRDARHPSRASRPRETRILAHPFGRNDASTVGQTKSGTHQRQGRWFRDRVRRWRRPRHISGQRCDLEVVIRRRTLDPCTEQDRVHPPTSDADVDRRCPVPLGIECDLHSIKPGPQSENYARRCS